MSDLLFCWSLFIFWTVPLTVSVIMPENYTVANDDEKGKNKLNIITHPVECYNLMKKYIILSKRLNLLKNHWGARKLGLETIDCPEDFKMFK